MSLEAGDVLLMAPPEGNVRKHYTVVIDEDYTSGSRSLYLVSITSIYPDKYYDNGCVINPGDYPTITHPSFLNYNKLHIQNEEHLLRKIDNGIIQKLSPLQPHIFKKVIIGGASSDNIKERHRRRFEEISKKLN